MEDGELPWEAPAWVINRVRPEVDTSELENLQKALTFVLDLNEWLRRCEEEGRDRTHLGGCVKFYLPRPTGQWGAVLTGRGGGET